VNAFERLLATMTKPLVAISFMGLIVCSFLYLDRPIAYYFHNLDLRTNLSILNWVTRLGIGALYFIVLLLLALIFRYLRPNPQMEIRAWFLWLCVLIPSIICFVLKVLFGRARPGLLFDEQLYGFYGLKLHAPFWSFPSGHTTTVMGLVFGLCVLFPRYLYAFIVAGVLIVSSRILLTHHYLSDVLIATYLALLEVGVLNWWLRRKAWLQSAYGPVL